MLGCVRTSGPRTCGWPTIGGDPGTRQAAPLRRRPVLGRATAASSPRSRRPSHSEPHLTALLDLLEDLEQRKRRGTLILTDGSRVPVGNLDKVFWPEVGITKGELVRFYLKLAPYALPGVTDRPARDETLSQRRARASRSTSIGPRPAPEGLRVTEVRESPDKPQSTVPYLVGGSLQTILYMTQLAVISQDPWFSRVPNLEEADQVALDLDPMPGTSFAQVLDVACWLHDELVKLGIPSFPKTSGSEGLHIFIPLPPGTPYAAGMIYCQIVATVIETKHPDVATVERWSSGVDRARSTSTTCRTSTATHLPPRTARARASLPECRHHSPGRKCTKA